MTTQFLDEQKNKLVLSCWLIIDIVLTISYIIDYIERNYTLIYTLLCLAFCWLPLIITYVIYVLLDNDNVHVRTGACIGYIMFYVYTLFTSHSKISFVYIFPMLCTIIVYNELRVLCITWYGVILSNIIYVILHWFYYKENSYEEIATYGIQLSCIILCALFSIRMIKLLKLTDNTITKLSQDINYDELTSVHNRYFLHNYLKDKFTKEYPSITLAIIDIDGFKKFNDIYGHVFGDTVLRKIAHIIKQSTVDCKSTHVIRIGGDEFAIISTHLSENELLHISNIICNNVQKTVLHTNDKKVRITVSIGVANSITCACTDYDKLYEIADSALYTVKRSGKCSAVSTSSLRN